MSSLDQDAVHPSQPPPAPPLPPSHRYGHRAATAIARFAHPFFAGSRLDAQRDDGHVKSGSQSIERLAQTSTRKEAVHRTGFPISAIDISPYRTHAVLAGREILRTIRVDESSCSAEFDLRSGIISYTSTHDSNRTAITAEQREQLAAVDVKWSHGNFDTVIATAASNGRIIVYDLNRPSIEIARLHEHNRQVHRLAFNPHQPALLLSGSQDGTIRLWDLRHLGGENGRSMKTLSSIKRYSANSEGIRDVKWAFHDGLIFAIGTENGSVQKWDLRKENAPVLRLHGHDRSCSAIDWHPDGRYLASGSSEKLIKIWDFGLEDRRMKPINQIRTPQAVTQMKWRPNVSANGASSLDHGNMTTQISASYDARDPRIHVWDFQRPNVPVLELEKYETPATGLVWHSRDLLWSVGQTGTFTQNDMNLAFKPTKRHGSAIAIGSDGRIAFFSSKKPKFGLIAESLAKSLDQKSTFSEQAPDQVSAVKDVSPEEQITENTIQRRRQKTVELRSNTSFSSNPVEDKLERLQTFKSQLLITYVSPQLAAIGHIDGTCDSEYFVRLAEAYDLPSYDFLTGRVQKPHLHIHAVFEEHADSAEILGELQLAQTWRILAYLISNELQRRMESNKLHPLRSTEEETIDLIKDNHRGVSESRIEIIKPIGSSITADGSAISTPIARPRHDTSMLHTAILDDLDSLTTNDVGGFSSTDFQQDLPVRHVPWPAKSSDHDKVEDPKDDTILGENSIPESASISTVPELRLPFSGFPGLEEHLEESRNALNSYRARPRAVLSLDGPYGTMQDTSYMAALDRHDSNESFQMFSASADSDPQSFPLEDSFDERKSFSQISNGSFASLQPNFSRTRLDDLKEDDGQSTPLVVEPQELAEDQDLPIIEKVVSQTTNNLTRREPIRRPSGQQSVKIHKDDLEIHRNNDDGPLPGPFSDYTRNSQPPADLKPWSVYSMLKPLISHHTNALGDAQLPSVLAIWLWHFFPSEFNRAQITTLILFYHRRLTSLKLFEPAARLRQCCAILFPEVLEYTSGCTPAMLFCRTCKQAFEKSSTATNTPSDLNLCIHCRTAPAHCSICEMNNPPTLISTTTPELAAGLWSWCQGCGHGGHASCLSAWFEAAQIAEGACPILGCNHDCIPGIRREQVIAEQERQRKKHRKSVVRDDWSVNESKAVERARDIVAPAEILGRRGGRSSVAAGNVRRVRLLVDDQNGAALVRGDSG